MGRLESFARPSEVAVPLELLRAGVLFHARGLLNTRVIQGNLDWHWPYWVHRQFDPESTSFVPRSFSITHVNLSHRNWTALGLPGMESYPIVDPRGMVTPWYDGWSLAPFVALDGGEVLTPPMFAAFRQELDMSRDDPVIRSHGEGDGYRCEWSARVVAGGAGGAPACRIAMRAEGARLLAFGISIRPQNPEGVVLIDRIGVATDGASASVDGAKALSLSRAAETVALSDYDGGDALWAMAATTDGRQGPRERRVRCGARMASAALGWQGAGNIDVSVPLESEANRILQPWSDALAGTASMALPHGRWEFLFEAAKRSLVLHTPREAYPGPYTYRRFWFRDAAFIVYALLAANMVDRARRVLSSFLERQDAAGYFCSQEGEWDSNGQVAWIYERFLLASGDEAPDEWKRAIVRGARWICRKRTRSGSDGRHAGLMPAGFSAEHLGNNDYYYWDDFFSIAGLRSAARMARAWGRDDDARDFERAAKQMLAAVRRSLRHAPGYLAHGALPASPYRRMDSGAVGSLAASYPTRIASAGSAAMGATADYLHGHCLVRGAFFQNMIHSGANPYLTLHLAQTMLRSGDDRWFGLVQRVADFASPTGQWPEAINPQTGGGCMGDGHHVWASAEWVAMMRAMFVREEGSSLMVGTGLVAELLAGAHERSYGPASTDSGPCSIRVRPGEGGEPTLVAWEANWLRRPGRLVVSLPEHESLAVHDPPERGEIAVQRNRIETEAAR